MRRPPIGAALKPAVVAPVHHSHSTFIGHPNIDDNMTAPTSKNQRAERCITPTRAYVKACICPYGKDCASYTTRWLAVKDPLRCGFVTLPEYTKISTEDSSSEQSLKNKIRDVAYYHLNGPNSSAPEDDVPRFVALHHYHPLVLRQGNQGLISQFLDEKLANDIGVKDVRTYIFQQPDNYKEESSSSLPADTDNIVGKYICAPNYAWSSMVVNINRAESAFARANGTAPKANISPVLRRSCSSISPRRSDQPLTPERRQSAGVPRNLCMSDGVLNYEGQQQPLQIKRSKQSTTTSSVNSNLGSLTINARWSEAYIRCKQHPSEAKQWLVSRSARSGKVLFRKLPLHIACTFGAPKELIYALTEAYPESVNLADESGKLPLHSVFNSGILDKTRKQSVPEIVEHLLAKSPESAGAKDKKGMLALHRASSMGAEDSVVNKLFRANQRGVMTRDSRGRLPKHLVMRGYNRDAVRERILKKRTVANNARHIIDTGHGEMRVSQIVGKYEGSPSPALAGSPPLLPCADDKEERENAPGVSIDESNKENSIDGDVEESSKQVEERNDGSIIPTLTEEPPTIMTVRSNDTNASNQRRHRELRKKNIRLNRTRRTVRSKPKVILVSSDAPATIENFTCLSKKNKALKKEMKRLKKLTEHALEERTIENFTCVSKKNRKLKREMKRMQILTEQALTADGNGQEIVVEPTHTKKRKKRIQVHRTRFERSQKQANAKINSDEPVSIDKFTCMSKKGNRKLKKEMKKMQRIFEEAMIAQENGVVDFTSSKKQSYSTPASPIRGGDDDSSSAYSSIANSPARSASFRSSSNRSVASTITDSPKTIDNYTCTSKIGNKKLKEEMKRMQRMMQAELGQPVLPKKGKSYKLKKALRLRIAKE